MPTAHNRPSKLLLVMMVDALRHDYLDIADMPFCRSVTSEGGSVRLVPTFGFEPDAAYLAGVFPSEIGGGFQFELAQGDAPFRWTRFLPRCLDAPSPPYQRIFRRIIKEISLRLPGRQGVVFNTARVPLSLLPYFDLSLKCAPYKESFYKSDHIFKQIRQRNIDWLYHGPPDHRTNSPIVFERIKKDLKPPVGYALVSIGDLDAVGHKYGPHSEQLRRVSRIIDDRFKEMMELLTTRYDEVRLLIFGDHGMVDVNGTVNVQQRLDRLDYQIGKDYIYFLDSTTARFWSDRRDVLDAISDKLTDVSGGKILADEERSKYHIDQPEHLFGQLMFLADDGKLILPNFYQMDRSIRGMHGYRPECLDQQALLVSNRPIPEQYIDGQQMQLRDLYSFQLRLLDEME